MAIEVLNYTRGINGIDSRAAQFEQHPVTLFAFAQRFVPRQAGIGNHGDPQFIVTASGGRQSQGCFLPLCPEISGYAQGLAPTDQTNAHASATLRAKPIQERSELAQRTLEIRIIV